MNQDNTRPNIIVILVDDMGYSDLGFMGSEIKTPNLDRMALNGQVYTSMYNCGRCCPTRAAYRRRSSRTGRTAFTISALFTRRVTSSISWQLSSR